MTIEEFKNLKVGDKVKIVSTKKCDKWNNEGKMDKWLGKVMTIRQINIEDDNEFGQFCKMEEDINEVYSGWLWFPTMIEKKLKKRKRSHKKKRSNKNIPDMTIKKEESKSNIQYVDTDLRIMTYGLYSPEVDRTTVYQDIFDAETGEIISIAVRGWYQGEPNKNMTIKYSKGDDLIAYL